MSLLRCVILAVLVCALIGCSQCPGDSPQTEVSPPGSADPSGPRPSDLLAARELHKPPPLEKPEDVAEFVTWASASLVSERESARDAIAAAAASAQSEEIAQALAAEVEECKESDHSRALVVLSILGEMKTQAGARYLQELAWQPLPEKGTVIDGEIIERTALAILQAKAVDGLAYMRTEEADAELFSIVADHPSIAVRAEAISAYLWNNDDSAKARATLLRHVRKGEEIYLDRVRRLADEDADTFNAKLSAFLEAHPAVKPPQPEAAEASSKKETSEQADIKPPEL